MKPVDGGVGREFAVWQFRLVNVAGIAACSLRALSHRLARVWRV